MLKSQWKSSIWLEFYSYIVVKHHYVKSVVTTEYTVTTTEYTVTTTEYTQ